MKELTPLIWRENRLFVIDQRLLPHREKWLELKTDRDVYNAIKSMVIRGAPAIGIVAAFGFVLKMKNIKSRRVADLKVELYNSANMLKSARPTAVNLRWAIERIFNKANSLLNKRCCTREDLYKRLEKEALKILEEDIKINRQIGKNGNRVVPRKATILTHCNAGALAVGGYGTAIGVIRAAFEYGKDITVFVDETRPYLQGARLTTYELKRLGIKHYLITDNMAGYFINKGDIDLIVTGADRIAQNGDTANKIGTYTLAVLAKENNVPFYIAAPSSTFDMRIEDGSKIPIEERDENEVLNISGRGIAAEGVRARHIGFDVTPAKYITSIITEKGIIRPPYKPNIKKIIFSK